MKLSVCRLWQEHTLARAIHAIQAALWPGGTWFMYRPEYPRLKVRLFSVSAGATWVQQQRRSAGSAVCHHWCCSAPRYQKRGAGRSGRGIKTCLQLNHMVPISAVGTAAMFVTTAEDMLHMQATVLQG